MVEAQFEQQPAGAPVITNEPRMLTLGMVTFCNTQLVPKKLIDLYCLGLEEGGFEPEGYGIFSVIFRDDGQPVVEEGVLNNWAYFSNTFSAVCNIQHCLEMAMEESLNEENEHADKFSFKFAVWQLMLAGFFHEAHHGHTYMVDGEKLHDDDEFKAEEEKRADEFSRQMLFTLAKKVNIEPEFGEELNSVVDEFWSQELELIAENWDEATEKQRAWWERQKYMFENGCCWYDPPDESGRPYIMETYKEFLHWVSGEDKADPDWNTDTQSIPVTVTQASPQTTAEEPFVPDEVPGMQGVQGFYKPNQHAAPPIGNERPSSPVVENQPVYQNAGMDTGAFQNVVKGLYLKIFQHIFQGCGFNPGGNPPFLDGGKITQPVGLSRQESDIVKEMFCYDTNGRRMNMKVENYISGIFMDRNNTLPGFDLTLTDADGNQVKRKFIPQNPNKYRQSDGQLSSTAVAAREGNQIMWIINPDSPDKQFALRVWNGVLQSNNSGQWINV